MKLSHKINHNWSPNRTDPAWAERVEREAAQTTARTAAAVAKARKRLDRALKRAEVEQARTRPDRKKVRDLWRVVEARRQELLTLQGMMQASPAGHQRHRPVPGMRTL